jgi:DNA-binding PadR family transcriptional regulator
MSLRIALLGALAANGALSGYDLAKSFDGSLSYVWPARHSQIYPELAKLATDGLATVREDGGRGRKVYEITEDGRTALARWLTGAEPSRGIRSEASLRMFLLPLLDPAQAVPLLRQEAERYAEQVRELERVRDGRHPPTTPGRNGWYALDLGIRQMAAIRDWATATADHIAELTSPGPG